MSDLVVGLILLGSLSFVLFLAGSHLGRTLPARWVTIVGLALLVAVGADLVFLSDSVRLAEFLPVSNLIVVGHAIPLTVSLLSGLAWSWIPRQATGTAARSTVVRIRRIAAVALLQGVAWTLVVRPIWGSAPRCGDRWEGDFCVQTTATTCTAACAATLLRGHGIAASEQEMADLCLTRRGGTLWQGLYRGLKVKTAGTSWDVEILHGPFRVLATLGDGPAILMAGVPGDVRVARIYTERYGWTPGEWHSVLFFGFRGDGLVAMGDPTPGIGRENWSEDDLRVLWGGRGMRLVHRGPWPRLEARAAGVKRLDQSLR